MWDCRCPEPLARRGRSPDPQTRLPAPVARASFSELRYPSALKTELRPLGIFESKLIRGQARRRARPHGSRLRHVKSASASQTIRFAAPARAPRQKLWNTLQYACRDPSANWSHEKVGEKRGHMKPPRKIPAPGCRILTAYGLERIFHQDAPNSINAWMHACLCSIEPGTSLRRTRTG
jgi:hypothetical protein